MSVYFRLVSGPSTLKTLTPKISAISVLSWNHVRGEMTSKTSVTTKLVSSVTLTLTAATMSLPQSASQRRRPTTALLNPSSPSTSFLSLRFWFLSVFTLDSFSLFFCCCCFVLLLSSFLSVLSSVRPSDESFSLQPLASVFRSMNVTHNLKHLKPETWDSTPTPDLFWFLI